MNPFRVFKQAFQYFVHQPMLLISFIGVAIIPILYSGFLIKGAWDPYGQLSNLPVAVVNMDQGATIEGEALNVGQDFVAELKQNTSFAWEFVSEGEAEQGMKGNHYYASLTIPANFSEKAASLTSDHPKQAEIIFESNSYYNYVAGQISENATRELKDKLSQNMTETYSRSIYKQFEALSSGLSTASDGALELNKGAIQLGDGVSKLKGGLGDLVSGASQINSKVSLLLDGATKVGSGAAEVSSGATNLSTGAKKVSDAGLMLQEGAVEAEQGSTTLRTGIQSTKEGADQLTKGLQSSVSGLEQLQTGLEASTTAIDELATGSTQVASGLKKVMDNNADLASNPELQKLLAASQEVSKGSKALLSGEKKLLMGSQSVVNGQQKLLAGSQSLSSGQSQLYEGASDLQTGLKQLSAGLKQVNTSFNQIVSGSSVLAQGASQVSGGASQLHTGVGQMADGIKQLASGASQLNSGTVPLADGVVKLVDGTHELASQLKDAAEKSTVKANDEMISMLAQPVTIVSNNERKVSLYGNGIAPYFISMALFAGALVFTTIISARSTIVKGARGIPLFISKTLTFGLISLAQSLIAVTILMFMLGLKVQSVPLFYLFTILVGFTFMFIIQAIVTWLDLPGRFVVLLLMIFQLASSAGTFPLELLPGWAKAMNPLLPMTYSIRGFRDVINSGDYSDMWNQVARLAVYLIVFLLLTLVYFLRKTKDLTEEQLMPVKV